MLCVISEVWCLDVYGCVCDVCVCVISEAWCLDVYGCVCDVCV